MKTLALHTILAHCLLTLTVFIGTANAADPATPMITYQRNIAELANQGPTPLLAIYADGKAVVHIPSYMKKAGIYEMQLSQGELQQLINEIRSAGLPSFDNANVRAIRDQMQAENALKGLLAEVSDDEITVIELELPAPKETITPSTKRSTFRWKNLQFDAKQFDIPALRAAAQAERRLLSLAEDIVPRQ